MLYPRESETREVRLLDGLWEFCADYENSARKERWQEAPLRESRPMPVPASYNDLSHDGRLRDHVGEVFYQRRLRIPHSWHGKRFFVRFGAVWHKATVWINGIELGAHHGGYLPFRYELPATCAGNDCLLTVAVSNELDYHHLPHGEVKAIDVEGSTEQRLTIHGDVRAYAGIHRSVWLTAEPISCVLKAFRTWTTLEGGNACWRYTIEAEGAEYAHSVAILREIGVDTPREWKAEGETGAIVVESPRLWSPCCPFLYEVEFRLIGTNGELADCYKCPIGLRTIAVAQNKLLLNGTPVTLKGFGKTEDFGLRGRGIDDATLVKDFELMKWVGANSFRTAHHPFSEETLQLADRYGIMVIDEMPALSIWIPDIVGSAPVGTVEINNIQFSAPTERDAARFKQVFEDTLAHHKEMARQLIARDYNHPCVIMWSLGNEINTSTQASRLYLQSIAETTRACDLTRPITQAECFAAHESMVSDLVDIVSINRYYAWYRNPGHLHVIEPCLRAEFQRWFERFGKPIILTEFGADAIAGLHQDPPVLFSEEFQSELIERYLAICEQTPFVLGAHVWVFSDFDTEPNVRRVDGNKKGVFTRDRRPKMAAHTLRKLWNL